MSISTQRANSVVENFTNIGPLGMSDAELIAFYIFGTAGADQYLPMIQMGLCNNSDSINTLFAGGLVPIGNTSEPLSAAQLKAEKELIRRRGMELIGSTDGLIDNGVSICQIADVHQYLANRFSTRDIEEYGMIGIDHHNKVIEHRSFRGRFVDVSIRRNIRAATYFCFVEEVAKLVTYVNRSTKVSVIQDGSDMAFMRRLRDELSRVDTDLLDCIFVSNNQLESQVYEGVNVPIACI